MKKERYIHTNGKIGLGHYPPDFKLEVVGNVSLASPTPTAKLEAGGTTTVKMCSAEKALTEQERANAWDILYECLHVGNEESRPIMIDQSRLIVLINKLTKPQQ